MRRLVCIFFHARWRWTRPSGLHQYRGHCDRCDRDWLELDF